MQSVDEALLDLGDILSFDSLSQGVGGGCRKFTQRLTVCLKWLFASKAMKQMAGLSGGQVIEGTTMAHGVGSA